MRGHHWWLENLVRAERSEPSAICDRDERTLAREAAWAGIPLDRAYAEVDDLLSRPDADAVAIVVAPEYQPDIALRALAAGKHVLCEVPLHTRSTSAGGSSSRPNVRG
jgi:predicted dehydrogenase